MTTRVQGVLCALMTLATMCCATYGNAGEVTNTRVTGVYCGIYGGANMCSLYFDKQANVSAACATFKNRMQFKTDTSIGKSMLAVVLLAYAQEKHVYAAGTETCVVWSDTEDLNTIFIQPN